MKLYLVTYAFLASNTMVNALPQFDYETSGIYNSLPIFIFIILKFYFIVI